MSFPTFDEWLGALDAPALEQLIALRPDATLGAPVQDMADLAERLSHPASVAAVVHEIPTPALQALDALAALGVSASEQRLADLLAPGPRRPQEHADAVADWLAHLFVSGLAWPDGDRVRLNPGVLAVLPCPLGVGQSAALLVPEVSAEALHKVARRWGVDVPKRKADVVDAVLTTLGDPAAVRRIAGAAPSGVTDVLLSRARDAAARMEGTAGADGGLPDYLRTPGAFGQYRIASAWAVDNGLAFGPMFDPLHAELPSEVLLALADSDRRAPFAPDEPVLTTAPLAPEQAATAASASVTELVGTVMATLEHLLRAPVSMLKSRGVGAREISRLAKAVDGTTGDVRLALELAAHLGLLGSGGPGRLGVGEEFARWRRLPPARRAAELLQVWASVPYVPTAERDDEGKAVPALARLGSDDAAIAARAVMLGVLGELPDDVGATSAEAVAAVVRWRVPVAVGEVVPDVALPTLAEAERLGVVAFGRLTGVGRAIISGWTVEELTARYDGMLPDVQTRASVGSDLTVVVMGSPAPEVTDLLDAVAVREARGNASTWRLTSSSVRGALDAGYAADDVLGALRRLAGGELPQPLEYLVRDVARRHGHLAVQPAVAVITSADEALVLEVAVHRALRGLGLRVLAPTVLLAATPVDEVLVALRGAGYLPVEGGPDGSPVVSLRRFAVDGVVAEASQGAAPVGVNDADDGLVGAGGDGADAALARWVAEFGGLGGLAGVDGNGLPSPGARVAPPEPPAPESPADVVDRLLRGGAPPRAGRLDGLAAELARHAPRLRRSEIEQLAHAVAHRLPVRIRYRSRSGGVTVRVISDLDVQHGYLLAWCHLRQGARSFALANVLGVIAEPA